jgi:hypothetical protein
MPPADSGYRRPMEMGDNDGGGGGIFVGAMFDGLGWVGTLVLLAIVIGLGLYCAAEKREQRAEFCHDVCAQYDDAPVVQGSQCYCRDARGIYDPATTRGR